MKEKVEGFCLRGNVMGMSKNLLLHFFKGIGAGIAIGIGGFFFVLMSYALPGEWGKVLGSLLFGIGLLIVCTFSLSLYTGKIGLIYEGKKNLTFYLSLPVMLSGNAIGAVGLGMTLHFALINSDMVPVINATVASRLVFNDFPDYLSLMVRSFLCGFCVYMSVKFFNLAPVKPLGIFGLFLFVFIFVYAGFQHCVANMFYFGLDGCYEGFAFLNVLLCVIFNSLGPIAGVALFKIIPGTKGK